ncbi:MAG: ABC transporter permease [Lachnospiraceae bacterium]|nr:ABC transporter permease [Lachnospiraceae bacterium]
MNLIIECKKHKRKYHFLVLGALLLLQALYLAWGMDRADHLPQGWMIQLYNLPILNSLLLPTVMAVLASRHMELEHKASSWKQLYTLESPAAVIGGKLIYGFTSIFLFCLVQMGIMVFTGVFFAYGDQPDPLAYLLYFIDTLAVSLVLYLLQSLLSFLFHNQAVSISIGLCGSLAGLFILYLPPSLLYEFIPWGLFGATMFVRLDWNPVTRVSRFYYVMPNPVAYLFTVLWIVLLLFLLLHVFCHYEEFTEHFTLYRKHFFDKKKSKKEVLSQTSVNHTLHYSHLPVEWIKMKRTPIWLAFLLLPAISAVIGTLNYMGNLSVLDDGWYSLWSQHTLFLCYFFMPPLLGVLESFLWRLEHSGTNWNQLLTLASPWKIIGDKLFLSFCLSLLIMVWIFILYIAGGVFANIQAPLPEALPFWFLFGMIGSFAICCTQSFFSLIIRNFALPIGIALSGGIVGLLLSAKGFWYLVPYSLLSMGMSANNPYYELPVGAFLLTSCIFILLFTGLSIRYLQKADVITQE